MFTINDITSQLASLFNGGQYQGNGVTTFAAPDIGAPSIAGSNASFPVPASTGAGSLGGAASAAGLGMNMPTLGLALGGFQALSGLLQGNKALGLAKDQFKFQKDVTNTNLNNSIKSYNTALEDRLRARGAAEGTDAATVQANIDRNRLTR